MRRSADQGIRSDQITKSSEIVCGAVKSVPSTPNAALVGIVDHLDTFERPEHLLGICHGS